jgi:hypothetical protein
MNYNNGNSATAAASMKQQKSWSPSFLLVSSDEEETYRSVAATVDGDVDAMLKHEDFPELLGIAVKMETLHGMILESTGQPWTSKQSLPKSSLTVEETFQGTLILQDESKANSRARVRRGEYPITDALMDDSLKVLRREYDDMFCFRFTPPSMRAGLVNRSRPCRSLQDKGLVDGRRQTEQPPVSRKRNRSSPNKKGMPSKRPSKWNGSVCQPEVIVIDDDDDEDPELIPKQPLIVAVKQQRLPPSDVASTMMGSLKNAADSPSVVVGLKEDFKISPEMFDQGDYCKFDGDGGFELINEFSDAWLANNDSDDFLCAASVDDLIRENDGEVGFVCSTTEHSRSTSLDDLDLGEDTLESWANQFRLSLE